MKTALAVLAAGALILAWFIIETSRVRVLTRRTFSGRTSEIEDHAFQAHFESKGIPKEVVVEVRAAVATELGTDPLLLRPDDNFTGNLRPLLGEEQMGDLAIIRSLEKRYCVQLEDAELESCKTVGDLVLLVSQLHRGAHAG